MRPDPRDRHVQRLCDVDERGAVGEDRGHELIHQVAVRTAVAAGVDRGGWADFGQAQQAACGVKPVTFKPKPENHAVYQELYRLYAQLHDGFGTRAWSGSMFNIMKDLLAVRDRQRRVR